MTEYSADTIIIGGGIVGCAAAYYLTQRGADVLLIERRGIGSGATGRSGGGVRQSARVSEEIPLAMESVALFPSFSDELGVDIEYTRGGNLRLVEIPDHMRPMQVDISRQQKMGLDLRWVDADETCELVPALKRESVVGASYCATDGHCNPMRLVTGFYEAALRGGLRTITAEARGIDSLDSGEVIVRAGEHSARASHVVIAAGSGSYALCRSLGFDLPLANVCYESMITEALPPLVAQMFGVATGDLFFRQTQHGGVHFGGGVVEEREDELTTGKNIQTAVEHMLRLLPGLADVNLLRTWGGMDPNTPDGMPIVDTLTEHVILATGFCGHGLAVGPIVGQHLAAWIAEGEKPEALAPFRRKRLEGWLQTRWTPSGTFEASIVTEESLDAVGRSLPDWLPESLRMDDPEAGPRLLVINPDLCTGCRMCEMACAIQHDQIARPTQLRIQVAYPSDDFYTPLTCIHCEEAFCMDACSFDALTRDLPDGIVRVIEENCTGCMLCVPECPYGGIRYVEDNMTVVKCDLCGGDPACAAYCAPRAIVFAPLDDETWERMKQNATGNLWALIER